MGIVRALIQIYMRLVGNEIQRIYLDYAAHVDILPMRAHEIVSNGLLLA